MDGDITRNPVYGELLFMLLQATGIGRCNGVLGEFLFMQRLAYERVHCNVIAMT